MSTCPRPISCSRLYKALLFCGLLAACLSLTASARAGSWSGPSYAFSGTDGNGNSWTWPINSGTYFNSQSPGYSASGSASGKVTATFTWNPDPNNPSEPPTPLCVLETADASAVGGTSTASASDGLGDTATITDTSTSTYTSSNADSHGGYLTLAGTTSPVVLTHTLSATCPKGMTYQLSYKAAGYPVSLSLGGGIGTSDAKRYLIGQKCTATLSTSGLTPTTCSWSVSGGDPFSRWAASQNSAVFTPLNTGTGSQMSCYFKKPDSATISCTAHLASPSGVLPTGGLDVSINKQPKIEKPSAQLSVDIGMVEGWPVSAPNFVQLIRNESYAGSGNAAGIQWVGTIQTPFDYGEGGQWNWTQLITPQRKRIYNGSWEFIKSSTVTPPDVTGGEYLDGSYPYGTYWYSANGIPTGNADSPSEGLPADPLFTTVVVHDSFRDYLMYQPPGNDSVAVPLKRSKWFWQFGATQSNGAWNVSNTDAQWSFDGDFPDYPTWNGYLGVSSLYYNF